MSTFLSPLQLERIGGEVATPRYERSAVQTGIVHFGPGAFHRAHQAWFVESVLERDPRWGICAVSLRSRDLLEALRPQGWLYTLALHGARTRFQIIGALKEVLFAPEQPGVVIDRLASPHTHVVTLSVTEKGYCLGANGGLDLAHADIQHDLSNPSAPRSVLGYLVAGLAQRHRAALEPFTVISCDNLADNGVKLKRAAVELATALEPALGRWIERGVAFPRTMVDSITPATTDALREEVAAVLGLEDRWPVQREEFAQWVIEDYQAPVRPDWATAGVTLTDDVGAYDRAKLRLLNGAHSTLAYLGLRAGYETVAQAMSDPDLVALLRVLILQDILPTLTVPRGLDLHGYVEAILVRFRNPSIRHLLSQIAWDGSQKLPVRVLGTIHDNLAAGRPIHRLCLSVAGWMHFVREQARDGRRVTDPLAETLFDIGIACDGHANADVARFLALEGVFPAQLASDPRFVSALTAAYDALSRTALPSQFITEGTHKAPSAT